ncbi:MAG: helix-turn-helix domain-containing protein [Limisphaerales bacterium]
MDLKQAQEHFSGDAKFRQQYDRHKDGVDLAMQVLAIRKELGISHAALATELGISKYDISKIENLRGRVAPWVISVIVTRFQNELRKRGIEVEKWFVARPPPQGIALSSGPKADVCGRPIPSLQNSREGRSNNLPISRQSLLSEEEKKNAV